MMKRIILLTILLMLLVSSKLFPQARIENKLTFYDAESWVLFEDYKEAIQLYLRLNKFYPNNANFKYRIGQCYINIPGEKEKAVSFLEDAVKNINPKYKEGRYKETGAPYDALYYLANAYRINNQLDKALETYELFRKNMDPDIYDSTIVNQQIQSCHNAQDLMDMPLFVREKNIGNNINENGSDYNPVISDDENTIIFTRSQAFYDAIMISTKTNGAWSGLMNMNEILKIDVERKIYPTSLSNDGKVLYLYGPENYDGVIFSTTFENGTWGPLIKLNENINTKYWESHATISHDNKKLYFTSNRKGTIGGLDIYVSERDSTGDWGTPVNLGPEINTPYNEETPFLSKDDKTLYFSSKGHFNMGGYDIFYSSFLDNGKWSVPLNVGFPLNSTDDDIFYKPVNQGYIGYFAKYSPDGYGDQDIYRIEIFSDDHPRKFLVRGMVKVADLMGSYEDSVKISLMNLKNPNQILVVYSNPGTGEYEIEIPQGNYEITYESPLSEKVKRNLELSLNNPSDTFLMPGTVLPKTDFVADLYVESNKNISVSKGDTILFPLKVEPKSILTVEHWIGDSLIYSEQFTVTDSTFNYKMVPLPGDNKLTFKITDKFSNSTTTDVFISRTKDLISEPLVRPEYSRIIAKKQIAALMEMLKNRADDKLRKVIEKTATDKQQFGKVDDLISYVKEEAAKHSISPEEVDMLALKVAVLDNVLTQAAVDLMAKYTEGDLKNILEGIDIYQLNLKTWTDLQEYIASHSGGKITPKDLNDTAANILANIDPSIAVLKEKILVYGDNSGSGTLVTRAVAANDDKKIKKSGEWLQSFYEIAAREGFTDSRMAEMIAVISTLPDTEVNNYLKDLSNHTIEPFLSWINSIELKKEKIKTPENLILYILRNREKGNIPETDLYKSLADLITSGNIPAETIKSQLKDKGCRLWYLWLLIGIGIFFFLIIYRRKKKKEKDQ